MNPSNPSSTAVRVMIFSQQYTLRAKDDPREIEELARRVDNLMNEIGTKTGHSDSLRVAVLACLHLADRAQTLEKALAALKSQVDEKTEHFSVLLEQALEGEEDQAASSLPSPDLQP